MSDQPPDRREFLASVGLLPLLGSAGLVVGGDESKLIPDAARALPPSAADLGTNFAAVEQIAARVSRRCSRLENRLNSTMNKDLAGAETGLPIC